MYVVEYAIANKGEPMLDDMYTPVRAFKSKADACDYAKEVVDRIVRRYELIVKNAEVKKRVTAHAIYRPCMAPMLYRSLDNDVSGYAQFVVDGKTRTVIINAVVSERRSKEFNDDDKLKKFIQKLKFDDLYAGWFNERNQNNYSKRK